MDISGSEISGLSSSQFLELMAFYISVFINYGVSIVNQDRILDITVLVFNKDKNRCSFGFDFIALAICPTHDIQFWILTRNKIVLKPKLRSLYGRDSDRVPFSLGPSLVLILSWSHSALMSLV